MCEEDKEQIKLIYCHPFTITILSHKPSFRLKMLKELLGQQVVEEDGVDDKVLWAPLLLRFVLVPSLQLCCFLYKLTSS